MDTGNNLNDLLLENLRRTIKEKGWSASRLARSLGATPAWLTRILSGERGMHLYDLFRICGVLGVSVTALLDGFPETASREQDAEEVAKQILGALPDDVRKKLLELAKK